MARGGSLAQPLSQPEFWPLGTSVAGEGDMAPGRGVPVSGAGDLGTWEPRVGVRGRDRAREQQRHIPSVLKNTFFGDFKI